jgi:outer membrane protein, adhesin transport system
MKKWFVHLAVAGISATGTSAMAQATSPLAQAAQTALQSNPEVSARFNALRASVEEIGVARGGFLPRVDLTAEAGRTEDRFDNRRPEDQTLNRTGVAVTVTQLLWDGLATSREVDRLGHSRLTRYFEFIDASEQTALQAAAAYYDVMRYRRLVSLAEDNYVQHKYAFEQIQSRVKAGVGRGVDLEQSGARLALAESNLVTEKANLHDVTERYRRIVGEAPPKDTPTPGALATAMPGNVGTAIQSTASGSPAIAAAIENLRAVRKQVQSRSAAYQPTVTAQLRAGIGHNLDGTADQQRDTTALILLNWNLFNGGSDQARERQLTRLLEQATDLRDKACRDTRQTTSIAFNDTLKLTEQIGYLQRNVLAIEKARDAYRQQFDIGQRSLLDLLNAENELYTAKRALAESEVDLGVAQVRTFAGMGALVPALGLTRTDTRDLAEVQDWQAGEDGATRCPLEPTVMEGSARTDLDARARALIASAPPTPTATIAAAAAAADPALRVREWASAWSARDASRYLAFYSPSFKPTSGTRTAWEAQRKRSLAQATSITVQVDQVVARALAADRVETTFEQTYVSGSFRDSTRKAIVWQREGGNWVIVSESTR